MALDADGYPEDDDIKAVEAWPYQDCTGLLAFVESIWWPDGGAWGWTQEDRTYNISTGGWSGNEEIIGALRANYMFWAICWQQSRRGGHYIFVVPEIN